MAKTLTDAELAELRELIDSVDYRLVTSNYQVVVKARRGATLSSTNSFEQILTKELVQIERIRALLGLPLRMPLQVPDPQEVSLREQLVKKGIEPGTYRDVQRVQEKRAASRKTST